jgi:polysaccharide export outer membrane protein
MAVAALALVMAGCGSAQPGPDAKPEASASEWWQTATTPADEQALREKARNMVDRIRDRREEYRLGPDDLLRIAVWNRPDLSKEGRVRTDGQFFMPLVGNVQADGLTVAQLQAKLREALGEVLRDPQVDVEVMEYASKIYYVFGQTIKPGAYPVKATTTVLEGVATAGGPTDKANLGASYLIRGGTVVPVDFHALFERGDISQNLLLADGDILYLPSMDDAKVYVLGEVNNAAAVPMRTGRLRLSEAIALAGGFNELTAYKRSIKVVRGALSNPQVFTVDYTEILRGEKPDVAFLQSGDLVYVPSSGLTKWDRVLGQLLPNLSRIILDAASINSLMRSR